MNAIPTVCIPVYNRGDLLLKSVLSIKCPWERLVIVVNGKDLGVDRALRMLPQQGLIVVRPPYNLGYGASVNLCFREFPGPWFVTANDAIHEENCVAGIMSAVPNHPNCVIFAADIGLMTCLMMPELIERVGTYDENFYPAYVEDVDFWWRVVLSRVETMAVPGCLAKHLGSQTIKSDSNFAKRSWECQCNNAKYFLEKWGSDDKTLRFKTPYNRPGWPIREWELNEEHYRRNFTIMNGNCRTIPARYTLATEVRSG